jgi:hypothetical protein
VAKVWLLLLLLIGPTQLAPISIFPTETSCWDVVTQAGVPAVCVEIDQ